MILNTNKLYNKLIFEYKKNGKSGIDLFFDNDLLNISNDKIAKILINDPIDNLNKIELPELSEVEVCRHYTKLSTKNFSIDTNTYPLGSCTMKYNPKINEWVARANCFSNIHPYMPIDKLQFSLSILWDLQNWLSIISGFHSISLQPAAGAHAEFTGIMMMKAASLLKKENRNKILIPDTAHGTNPATANMTNLEVITLKSNEDGYISASEVSKKMDTNTLGIMITNPNTLGIFEKDINIISNIIHERGGYVYGDGANLNAIMGKITPGTIGFDIFHFNLHKTFSTPHGGGGPGCGALGVNKELSKFLPPPIIKKSNTNSFFIDKNRPNSIGTIRTFFGNFSVILRAWTYIKSMGTENLFKATEMAVLNANYIRAKLNKEYHIPYKNDSLHEIILSDKKQKDIGNITAMDIAKRLTDYNIHPPTIYFPSNIPGAIMIEPTESESINDLDYLCYVFLKIAQEVKDNPSIVKNAPQNRSRLDEKQAIKNPILKWEDIR